MPKNKRRDNPHWAEIRGRVLHRDNHRCMIAGKNCEGRADQVDHIVPVVSGGSDSFNNLRAACKPCNTARWHHSAYIWHGEAAPPGG